MMGGFYCGAIQWLIHKELPPSLKTIIPTASGAWGLDFPIYSNIFYSFIIQYLGLIAGNTENRNLMGSDCWQGKYEEMYNDHIPFNKLDSTHKSNSFVKRIVVSFYSPKICRSST